MPLLALIAIFVAVPLVELYVIIELVGPAIGAPLTVVLLAGGSLLGATLLKSQGRQVWRRFTDTLRAGALPHREVVDGMLVIFGGAFLIAPGFVTDAVGLLALFPPTRALLRRLVMRRIALRGTSAADGRIRVRRPHAGYDVDGTATERPLDVDFELPPRTSRRPRL